MLTLDHVVYAGSDHDALVERFADAGLIADYGGVHSHGTTQMSVVGFPDGTYLELIGPAGGIDPEEAQFWPDALAADAGPTAWAVLVDDATEATVRHVRAGVPVDGPHRAGRERDDGTRVEWTMTYVGAGDDRLAFPFCIADRTPRQYRVTPTDAHADGPLAGVAEVVLAVDDADAWADRLARVHGFPTPVAFEHGDLAGSLRSVPGQPVTLAERNDGSDGDGKNDGDSDGDGDDDGDADADPDAPLRGGLGPGPAAYLLGTPDLDAARKAYDLTETARWHGRRLAWVDGLDGEVGVVEPAEDAPVSAGPFEGDSGALGG